MLALVVPFYMPSFALLDIVVIIISIHVWGVHEVEVDSRTILFGEGSKLVFLLDATFLITSWSGVMRPRDDGDGVISRSFKQFVLHALDLFLSFSDCSIAESALLVRIEALFINASPIHTWAQTLIGCDTGGTKVLDPHLVTTSSAHLRAVSERFQTVHLTWVLVLVTLSHKPLFTRLCEACVVDSLRVRCFCGAWFALTSKHLQLSTKTSFKSSDVLSIDLL